MKIAVRSAVYTLLAAANVMFAGEDAFALDDQARNASYCTRHFARAEREYGIPKHLLMAISATESGRWHDEAGMVLPWPWTINVEGQGRYFSSKHDAVTAVNQLLQKGRKSIDVGCMQISLQHHPDAFASVGEAFDPQKNVQYAAKFLRQKFEEEKSWRKAVAAYHSKTPDRGSSYFARVKQNWTRALAKLGGGGSSPYVRSSDTPMELAELMTGENDTPLPYKDAKRHAARAEAKSQRRMPRMKVIQVSKAIEENKNSNKGEVLIIRPQSAVQEQELTPPSDDSKQPNIIVASGAAAQSGDSAFVITTPQVIKASATGDGKENSSRRKGPNFIFY